MITPHILAGERESGTLIIVDHASNYVPVDVSLEIDPALLGEHMAIDIGTWDLAHAIACTLRAPAILATVSRLVIDLNREEDATGLIPVRSDGHMIPGNAHLDDAARAARINQYWRPYHAVIAEQIDHMAPKMLLSLHSFTPALKSDPDVKRPWEIGVLYNEDDRAARIAIPLFEAAGVITGDNEPYSGKILNATMNRHGEARGIAYLGIEVRQDLIDTPEGIARWANIISPIVAETRNRLALSGALET